MLKIKRVFRIVTGVFFIYIMAICFQEVWLKPFASFLIIQDSYKKGDLIVVSTGSYSRFLVAANLLKKNNDSHMLVLGDRRLETPLSGKSPLDIAKIEADLLGLPTNKLEFRHSTSTLVDARQTKKFMREKSLHAASIISDPYNMRRLKIIFNFILKDPDVELRFVYGKGRWQPDAWWKVDDDFKYVLKEWIKLPIDIIRIRFV
jgi:hypothetical protein